MRYLLDILINDGKFLIKVTPFIGLAILIIVILIIGLHQFDKRADKQIENFLEDGDVNE